MTNHAHYSWLVALISLLAVPRAGAEPSLNLAAAQGILVLHSGQILEGVITPQGDTFHVKLDNGEVRVRAIDVEVHCRNLEEAYWKKRSVAPLGNVHIHLDLVQWCIQHNLLGYAADELRQALSIQPHHPRIALLERRLQLARQPVTRTGTPAEAPQKVASAEDLDRLLRGMPEGTVERFTNTIQPLLLNSCTAASCHGPAGETTPRWVRVSPGRTTSRRITQRNLHATLSLIDRDRPLDSPLLTVPLEAHGTAKTPIFVDPQSPQYQQLVNWVLQVTQTSPEPQPQSVTTTPPLLQTMPAPGAFQPASTGVQQATFNLPLPALTPAAEELARQAEQAAASDPRLRVGPGIPPNREQPQRGEMPQGFQPRDAFDPAIFNRRFFPEDHRNSEGNKQPSDTVKD